MRHLQIFIFPSKNYSFAQRRVGCPLRTCYRASLSRRDVTCHHRFVKQSHRRPFMTAQAAIAAILGALLIGAMSPGPSFLVVARNAIGLSRRDGLATALGMGIGGVFFSGIALLGLYTLLAAVTWLYVSLKVAGGLYLIYLASKIWRGAKTPLAFNQGQANASANPRKSFWIGL